MKKQEKWRNNTKKCTELFFEYSLFANDVIAGSTCLV